MNARTLVRNNVDALLLFGLSLLLFFYTAPPTVFTGDSGDITLAAYLFGYAHPPGYPLYSFLGYIWSHWILPFGDVAWRMNLFSALWGSLSVVLVYAIIYHLTKHKVASVVGALSLAVAHSFWQFSIVAEVFAFHLFLSLLLLWCVLQFDTHKRLRYLYVASFVFSLGIAHHHMIILWVPGLVVLLIKARFWKFLTIRTALLMAVIIGSGLVWYAYLPLSARVSGQYWWGDPNTVGGVIDIFLRKMYGTLHITRGGSPLTFPERFVYVRLFALLTAFNFSTVGTVLAAIGVVSLWLRKRVECIALAVNFLVSGVLFLMFAGIELGGLFHLGSVEKFSLMPLTLFAIFVGYGVYALITLPYLSSIIKRLSSFVPARVLMPVIGAGLLFALPLYQLVHHWPVMNLRDYYEGRYFAVDTLWNIPPHAIMSLVGDTLVFNTRYVQAVEGFHDDVTIMAAPYEASKQQLVHKSQQTLGIDFSELSTDEIVQELLEQHINAFAQYSNSRPPSLPPSRTVVAEGMTFRLYDTEYAPSSDQILQTIRNFMNNSSMLQYVDLSNPVPGYADSVRTDFGNTLAHLGLEAHQQGDPVLAEELFRHSLSFTDKNPNPFAQLSLSKILRQKGQCDDAKDLLTKIHSTEIDVVFVWIEWVSLHRECFQDEQAAQEYEDRINAILSREIE